MVVALGGGDLASGRPPIERQIEKADKIDVHAGAKLNIMGEPIREAGSYYWTFWQETQSAPE